MESMALWLKELARVAFWYVLGVLVLSAIATVALFPWDVDPRLDESAATATFYEDKYATGAASKGAKTSSTSTPISEKEQFYIDFARNAARNSHVPEELCEFVRRYDLSKKRILEVGAGSGMLQDIVENYTALDISPTAARFFHKPFVEASATAMPFPNNSFDAVWSIWVLEHIPNPEKALAEMRRVVKPGGYLILFPAYDVSRYAALGYHVRPMTDFGWQGKISKTASFFTESRSFQYLSVPQTRLLRSWGARISGGPSRLHFVRLTPNYDQYWEADSDATTSLSQHELALWFRTRGDQCIDCNNEMKQAIDLVAEKPFLIIKVLKN